MTCILWARDRQEDQSLPVSRSPPSAVEGNRGARRRDLVSCPGHFAEGHSSFEDSYEEYLRKKSLLCHPAGPPSKDLETCIQTFGRLPDPGLVGFVANGNFVTAALRETVEQ